MRKRVTQLKEILVQGINIPVGKDNDFCQCNHWETRGERISPTVESDPKTPGNWRCQSCGASFPIAPLDPVNAQQAVLTTLGLVNQVQFWSAKIGDSIKELNQEELAALRILLPKFANIQKEMYVTVDNKKTLEDAEKKKEEE